VVLKVPKVRSLPFETAIIERYRRRESSVEEALVEMYLAGVSVRRVEDITEALWGTRVSSGTVSRLNPKIYRHIEAWRNSKIEGEFPYLFLDGVVLKRSWAGEVRNVSVLVAIGVGADGHRQILGVAEGQKEDLEGWRGFLRHLKDRGLAGVQLIISDACIGLVEAAAELFPGAQWHRCVVHFYRNVSSHVPRGKVGDVARMLKAIRAQEDRRCAEDKAPEVTTKLRAMRLTKPAELVEAKAHETLTYFAFPVITGDKSRRIIHSSESFARFAGARVVGAFPDRHSALMLVAARLRYIASTKRGKRRYLAMETLLHPLPEEAAA
jgi:putative transposase